MAARENTKTGTRTVDGSSLLVSILLNLL